MTSEKSPLTEGYQPVTWNFKLLAHDMLGGFGGMGEGMSVQIAPDGRRIIWLAHESAPKNFTAVDVSDPRKPKVVCQTDLPHANMRSNSLETCGNLMAVAYQTSKKDLQPAGFELFDISKPENPKSISFFDCSGPHSRGVHQLWFCDGEYVHCASGSRDFMPTNPGDDQFYRCVDVRNPSKPVEVGRWWMPGTRQGDNVMPPTRHPIDKGFRAHNTNVYPQRPDRCYLAYIDGGMFVLDISDKANPKKISHWTNSPPYTGFMHTIVPLFDRGLMLVTDESTENNAKDWPKLIWVLDARDETNLVSIATCPLPDHRIYAAAGRFGAHNIHENVPLPTAWQNDQIVLGTFFNGGLRAYDISNPYQPKEVGIFMPPAPPGAPTGTIQMNDVFVDERAIVYTVDRHVGGCTSSRWISDLLDLFPSREASPFGRRLKRERGARIPVTVVTGFLGAGKTTLIRRFLKSPEGQGTAVIVNEFGAVGIDDALVRDSAEETVLLGNGCLCCITRTDLQVALRRLIFDRERGTVPPFARILIETSGLADPAPILQTFSTDRALGGEFHIDVVLAVVDAINGETSLDDAAEARKQVILADRLIISKTDLATPAAVERLTQRLQAAQSAREHRHRRCRRARPEPPHPARAAGAVEFHRRSRAWRRHCELCFGTGRPDRMADIFARHGDAHRAARTGSAARQGPARRRRLPRPGRGAICTAPRASAGRARRLAGRKPRQPRGLHHAQCARTPGARPVRRGAGAGGRISRDRSRQPKVKAS